MSKKACCSAAGAHSLVPDIARLERIVAEGGVLLGSVRDTGPRPTFWSVYVDTSAFRKWYLNEAQSERFEVFISAQPDAAICRLTVVEFRSLLAAAGALGYYGSP